MMASEPFTALAWIMAICTALLSGTYLAFSVIVLPSLATLRPSEGIEAMNAINRVILKTAFMPLFFGSTVLALLMVLTGLWYWSEPGAGASFVAGFDDISPNGWDTIMDVNLGGTYHCTHAASEHLKDGGGAVVNVASVAGQEGAPYMSHYAAAKAAIINLTRTLAMEWAGDDVRVNCIAPGFVATPGLEAQMGVSADDVDRDEVDRRIGVSEEIADAVRFLASPAASFVVGETLTAGGVPQGEEVPSL